MKNLLLLTTLIFCFLSSANAQISVGIKAGVSPTFSPNTNKIFINRESPRNEFTFNVSNVNNAITAGFFADVTLDEFFFLRVEGLFTQYETTYETVNTWPLIERTEGRNTYREKTVKLNLPVTLGVHLGNFEINSGLVAQILLSNDNELTAMEGYTENLSPVQLGFQTGIGLNISNINLGLAYQLDFQNYGDHMQINGKSLALLNSPSRVVATVGFRF